MRTTPQLRSWGCGDVCVDGGQPSNGPQTWCRPVKLSLAQVINLVYRTALAATGHYPCRPREDRPLPGGSISAGDRSLARTFFRGRRGGGRGRLLRLLWLHFVGCRI